MQEDQEEPNKWHRQGSRIVSAAAVEQYRFHTEKRAIELTLTKNVGSPWVLQSPQLWSDMSLQTVAQGDATPEMAQRLALMKAFERVNDMLRTLPIARHP